MWTVTDGVHEGATIVIKNGEIHEIGTVVHEPEDAQVIDAKGLRIYPGIISLTSRGIVGRPPVEDTTDPFSLNMVLALAGGVTTVVSGTATAKLTYGSIEDMTLVENPWVPLTYSTRSASGKRTLRADLDKVRKYLSEKRDYDRRKARGEEDLEEPDGKFVASGKYANFRKLLEGERPAHFRRVADTGDLLAICRLCRDYGIRAIIETPPSAWTVAAEIGRAGGQVILNPLARRDPDTRSSRPSGWTIENAAKLYDHGVPVAITAPSGGVSLGGQTGRDIMTVPLAAAFAVRGGLPEDVALAAITIEPARLLGVEDRIGSIEVGKDADLILVDGDLLHYETMVQWTLVNGKVVYDKSKESLFNHIRPREDAEEVDNLWPRRWIEEQLEGSGPGPLERDE